MVVLGADLHKRSHTIVVIDATGRQLAEKTIAATDTGHLELRRWAAQWPDRTWGLEDCRHLSRRLDAELVRAGESVVRVSPKLMAGARRSGREPGKSDPIDALAVARAVLREPDLPVATLDGPDREVRLLVDHREDLVGERTRHEQRLRWFLVELAIAEPKPRSLDRAVVQTALEAALAGRTEPVARFARDLLVRIVELSTTIRALEREIEALARAAAPTLLALPGCGVLTAAKIIGEAAGIGRFRSKGAFARHNGTAPVPVWSANVVRHRLNRGGNRQLNVALHRIAITQIRLGGEGKAYLEHRQAAGDTRTEAIRALRRRISDEVFRRLRADEADRTTGLATAA
ncbi:MAG TPA: IS110 family transposase [Candidatus Deferrimicrobium sp.]|nr:IS110 family transposase [Candidatus Deferrimicrobium sp.]